MYDRSVTKPLTRGVIERLARDFFRDVDIEIRETFPPPKRRYEIFRKSSDFYTCPTCKRVVPKSHRDTHASACDRDYGKNGGEPLYKRRNRVLSR